MTKFVTKKKEEKEKILAEINILVQEVETNLTLDAHKIYTNEDKNILFKTLASVREAMMSEKMRL